MERKRTRKKTLEIIVSRVKKPNVDVVQVAWISMKVRPVQANCGEHEEVHAEGL